MNTYDNGETLNLAGNKLGDAGIEILSETLKDTSLKRIDLFANQLTSKSVPFLIKIIQNNPNLETLGLGSNYLKRKGSRKILNDLNKYDNSILFIEGLKLNEEEREKLKKIYKRNENKVKNDFKNFENYKDIKIFYNK